MHKNHVPKHTTFEYVCKLTWGLVGARQTEKIPCHPQCGAHYEKGGLIKQLPRDTGHLLFALPADKDGKRSGHGHAMLTMLQICRTLPLVCRSYDQIPNDTK